LLNKKSVHDPIDIRSHACLPAYPTAGVKPCPATDGLVDQKGQKIEGSKILVLGITFKEN
jgi:hypothetical protein